MRCLTQGNLNFDLLKLKYILGYRAGLIIHAHSAIYNMTTIKINLISKHGIILHWYLSN